MFFYSEILWPSDITSIKNTAMPFLSAEFSTSSTDLLQNNKRTNVRNTFTVHTSGQLLLTQRVSWSCNLFFNRPNRNTFQVQPCTQSALWKGVLQVYNQSVLTCLLWLILDLISRRMILWLQALTLSITINIFQTTQDLVELYHMSSQSFAFPGWRIPAYVTYHCS